MNEQKLMYTREEVDQIVCEALRTLNKKKEKKSDDFFKLSSKGSGRFAIYFNAKKGYVHVFMTDEENGKNLLDKLNEKIPLIVETYIEKKQGLQS
jgi:hypothetical protein